MGHQSYKTSLVMYPEVKALVSPNDSRPEKAKGGTEVSTSKETNVTLST